MSAIASLLSILLALTLGAISPGPSFLFVMRTSVAASRRDGLLAAAGMGLGAATITTLALVGVRVLIVQVAWLYLAFKLLGGAYLVYLAWRIWQSTNKPAPAGEAPTTSRIVRGPSLRGPWRSFLLALATQFSNPKTVIVISGIFAALLPAHVPTWMVLIIPPVDFVIEASWYSFVAVAMSSATPRAIYLRAQKWIDRAAGCVLGALGLRLIFEGAREAG
jgi:threonine/homoserine/homoserine lactone efflux protein